MGEAGQGPFAIQARASRVLSGQEAPLLCTETHKLALERVGGVGAGISILRVTREQSFLLLAERWQL